MSGSFSFTTGSFAVASAQAIDAYHIRVTLTGAPDAFLPGNFSVPTTTIVAAVPDPGDPNSVILSCTPGLAANTYTVTCSGLTSATVAMVAPFSAQFQVFVGPQVFAPSSVPGENPSALTTLRAHIPPSMNGNVWAQLLATLGDEEQDAWDQAGNVYDQLFLVSANGEYLDARASAAGGYERPELVGFTDDTFRDLVIQLSTRKLTLNAFLRVLEIYYGIDAVRAHVVATSPEPYNIPALSTQVFNIDGVGPFTCTFQASDFSNVAAVTAIEAAVALNRQFAAVGAKALSLPYFDPQTGLISVAVYTASRGLRGAVEAVSGSIPFPTGKKTVQTQARAAYVRAVGGVVDVVLPATSLVVSRTPDKDAAYVNGPAAISITTATETNGTLTITTAAAHTLSPGSDVLIDGLVAQPGATNRCQPNGVFVVATTPLSNVFTVTLPALPATGTASYTTTAASITPLAATDVGGGPYLHDPTDALAVTDTTTTSTQALGAGHRYPSVSVASTTNFPDAPGYVVLGLGYSYQVGPVPYLGVGGTNQLLLDPSFVFPVAVPSGVVVNLALRANDDQLPHGDDDLWVTPSPVGRQACESDLGSIAAGGRDVQMTVIYPGDIGLGAWGKPTHGVNRTSDVVAVFASDDVDAEVAAARES